MGSYKTSVAHGLKLDKIRVTFLLVLDQFEVEVWKLPLQQCSRLKIRSQILVMNFYISSLQLDVEPKKIFHLVHFKF